jgi:hypothetical protein
MAIYCQLFPKCHTVIELVPKCHFGHRENSHKFQCAKLENNLPNWKIISQNLPKLITYVSVPGILIVRGFQIFKIV